RAHGRCREAPRGTLHAARRGRSGVKRLGQAVVAAVLGAFGFLVRMLPYRWALACGRAAGRAALALGVRRDVVLDNLARAYPQWSPAEVRATARRTYEIWGQVLVDLLRAPDLGDAFASIEGMDSVAAAAKEERGVILLSGHFGVFELLGAAVV